MASLNWKEPSPSQKPKQRSAAAESNLWFAVTLALVGFIIGYGLGQWAL